MPQSHISKIENGTIDLQTTSLLEIARAFDHVIEVINDHLEKIPLYKEGR